MFVFERFRRLLSEILIIFLDHEHQVLYSGPKRSEFSEGQKNYAVSLKRRGLSEKINVD